MRRALHVLPFFILSLALILLYRELHHIPWAELKDTLFEYAWPTHVAALTLLVINYAIWSGYDWTSLGQLGLRVPYVQILRTTSVAFPITNMVGYSLITGFATRWKRYERFGASYAQVTKLILFNLSTWWMGFLFLCGLAVVYSPDGEPFKISEPAARAIGIALLTIVAAYLFVASKTRGREYRFGKMHMHFPSLGWGFTKIAVSSADNVVVGLTLFVFLPHAQEISLARFMAYFLSAYLLALLSFVPAGWGVLEGALLYLLRPYAPDTEILAGLLLFRVYHYLLPAAAAVLGVLARKSYTMMASPRPAT